MGFVDATGKTIIPTEYDYLPQQWAPLMLARKGEFYGVLDGEGNIHLPLKYTQVQLLDDGWAAVSKDKSQRPVWSLANSAGQLVLPLAYEYAAVVDTHLLAARFFNAKELQIFDQQGQLRFKTEGAEAMPGFDDHSILIRKVNRSCYWVDLQGSVINPALFENTEWSDGDYFIRLRDNWFGVLNARGETVVPFRYRSVSPQHKGHFSVTDSTYRNALVDAQGQTLIEGEVVRWGKAPGSAYSKRWGIEYTSKVYDASGKLLVDNCTVWPVITEPQWNNLPENFYENYNWVQFKKTGLNAFYGADGKQILPPLFNKIQYCTDLHPLLGFILDEKTKVYEGTAYDFNGNPMLAQRYFALQFTVDPRILIGKKTHDGLWGFIDLRIPEKAEFVYTRLDRQPNGSYSGIRMAQQVNLTPTGQILPAGIATMWPPDQQGQVEIEPLESDPKDQDDIVFGSKDVDKSPAFPGGETAMFKFIAEHLNYPKEARKKNIMGIIAVSFIVEKDGQITDANILRDIGGGCGQEALRMVAAFPKWEPGVKNGKPVRTEFILPVRFKLE